MFIRNGLRFNIYASAEIDGVKYNNFLNENDRISVGITEIADPQPPEGFTPDTYYVNETDDAPYVTYTQKPAEQILAIRWERLKAIRDELTDFGGVFVANKWFHTDPKSKQQQMALMMLGQSLPAGIMWKTLDGSFIELTPTIISDLFQTQLAREQAIFGIAEQKRLDNSDINAGWPDRYVAE